MRAHRLAAVALGVVGAACSQAGDAPVDPTVVEAELTAAMTGFTNAVKAGDSDGTFAFMTPDVRMVQPGMDLSGDELRDALRALAQTLRVTRFEVRPDERFLHGDVAYELGDYEEVTEVNGARESVEGNYFLRWDKGADGQWRIDRLVAGPR
jgi:ketosteroid isomerase-like protein